MRVLADDTAALLDELGLERAHISGLSLGSTVAQEMAINYPDKVASLQLHATWGRTDEWLRRLFESLAFPLRHGDIEAFVHTAFMWVASPAYLDESPEEIAAVERAYIEENPHPPSIEAILGHLHADATHDAMGPAAPDQGTDADYLGRDGTGRSRRATVGPFRSGSRVAAFTSLPGLARVISAS